MKKKINKPMRAAGILLVATMLSTCLTAGTFAKYTTTDSATDTARVAKFGVVVNANGSLFGNEYVSGAVGSSVPTSYTTTGNSTSGSVQAYSNAVGDVVAPGTKSNTGMGIAVNGKPEVDVAVTYTVKSQNIRLSSGNWMVLVPVTFNTRDEINAYILAHNTKGDCLYSLTGTDYNAISTPYAAATTDAAIAAMTNLYKVSTYYTSASDYFPVIYSLTGTKTSYSTGTYTANSLEAITSAYNNSLWGSTTGTKPTDSIANTTASKYTYTTDTVTTVKANNDIAGDSGIKIGDTVLNWQWAFENGADATAKANNNKADTILGDLAARDITPGTFNGKIVKEGTTPDVFVEAVADTLDGDGLSTADKDYNLNTSFDISITVTQVD